VRAGLFWGELVKNPAAVLRGGGVERLSCFQAGYAELTAESSRLLT